MSVASHRRLNSWKEIAVYLGRDVRTAIRWEKERALPVHRCNGTRRSGVYAFSDEIDDWLTGGEKPVTKVEQANTVAVPAEGQLGLKRRIVIAAAALLAVVAFAAAIPRVPKTREGQLRREPALIRSEYPLEHPLYVAAADLTGNQRLDLIVSNGADGQFSVFANDGNGTFGKPMTLPVASAQRVKRVYVANLSDRKLPDLITSTRGGSPAEVLANRGRFQFEHVASIGSRVTKVAFGDFNGDGRIDIAAMDAADSSLSIYLNLGEGRFQQSSRVPVEDVSGWGIAAVGLNGDGNLDIVSAEYRSASGKRVLTFFGNGEGGLSPGAAYTVGLAPFDMIVGDFNHDRVSDIAVAELHGGISVLLGNRNGTFQNARSYAAGAGCGSILAADLDRDGHLDLVVLNEHSNDASLLFGQGDGTFADAVVLPTGKYPDGLAIADLDSDGRLDLAFAETNSNAVTILLNRSLPARRWGLPFSR